jgi:hypothetical protein
MSGNSETPTATSNPANALAELWTRMFEQSNQQARAMLDLMKAAGDPGELQRRWLDAIAQSLDGFMRTPAFLESMQHNLKVMTDLKGMQDRLMKDTAQQLGVPLAADITGLFERLNGAEQAILARLKGIEGRLKAIEARLDTEASHR